MKKLALSIALLGTSLFANAQFSTGPKIGFGFANVKETGDGASNDYEWNNSPTLGIDTKTRIAKRLSIQAAVQVTLLGYKINKEGYKNTTYLGYAQLPVKLNLQFKLAPLLHIGIGAGPYVGYFISGGTQDNSVSRIKAKTTVDASDPSDERYIMPWDYGLVAAPFVQIAFLHIAPTITYGLANTRPTYSEQSSSIQSRNLYYGLQVSFLFGGI